MEEDTNESIDDIEVVYLDDDLDDFPEGSNFDEEDLIEIPDLSKLTLSKHTKSVFCGDLSKSGDLAVTGGEDDCAFLWSTQNGEMKFECTGHKDSVVAVCFNHDGQYVATGDMSGMVQVWEIATGKLVWCYEGDDLEWLMWHPASNVLISGSHSGLIFLWQILQSNEKTLPSQGSACTCGKLLPDGKHLLAGYEDGLVKLWDIKSATIQWQYNDSQNPNISSIEINADGTLCSIAPSSTLLKVSDGKPIRTLLVDGEKDVEVHVFSKELNLLVTGSLTGKVCIWDLQVQRIRYQVQLDYGITTMIMGKDEQVFIGSTDGAIYNCDIRTGVFNQPLTGHKAGILSLSLSSQANVLLTTSDDTSAKIYSI